MVGRLLVALLLLVGCQPTPSGTDSASKPVASPTGADVVLKRFLDAELAFDAQSEYPLLSDADKAAMSQDEFVEHHGGNASSRALALALSAQSKYEIANINVDGTTANANVNLTVPDMEVVAGAILGQVMALGLANPGSVSEDQISQIIADKFSGKIPTKSEQRAMKLVQEGGEWHVFLDLAGEKRKAEIEKQVADLTARAKKLREQRRFEEAVEQYRTALNLDPKNKDASSGIRETEKEIKEAEQKQAYINSFVSLDKFRVADGERFGQTVKGVFGTVTNKGNRTLSELEITVYFQNDSGQRIAETRYYPVLAKTFSSVDESKLLKPNYVRDFGYSVEDHVPSTWSGKAEAAITDIEFDD